MEENPFADASVAEAQEALPAWLEDVQVDDTSAPLRQTSPLPPPISENYTAPSWSSTTTAETNYNVAPPPINAGLSSNEVENKQSDNLVIYMRLVNVASAILMSITAFFKIITFPGFNSAIIALYVWSFSLLLCCFETHLKFISRIIAQNFGFLYHVKGRCAFLTLVGMLCIGLGLFGFIAGLCILGAACFNGYVIYKHPEYEQQTMVSDVEQRGPETVSDAYLDPFGFGTMGSTPTQGGSAQSSSFSTDGLAKRGLDWATQNPQTAARALSTGVQFAADNPELVRSTANSATYGMISIHFVSGIFYHNHPLLQTYVLLYVVTCCL